MASNISASAEVECKNPIRQRDFVAGVDRKGFLEAGERKIDICLMRVTLSKLNEPLTDIGSIASASRQALLASVNRLDNIRTLARPTRLPMISVQLSARS